MKKKVSNNTTWSHHENMVINLRDWVGREIDALHRDIGKEAPHLDGEPHIAETISRLESLRKSLFETMSDLVEIAERESKKAAKTAKGAPAAKPTEGDDFDAVEA